MNLWNMLVFIAVYFCLKYKGLKKHIILFCEKYTCKIFYYVCYFLVIYFDNISNFKHFTHAF